MAIVIGRERPDDVGAIHSLHAAAFRSDAEARLVDALRLGGHLTISMVARIDGQLAGHVGFSPISPDGGNAMHRLGLAPLAVMPDYRRRGVGSELVRRGLEVCREIGVAFVVVLGDPKYYGRFGFAPASKWGMHCEFGGGDAFQAIELTPGAIPAHAGLVRYSPEFMLVS